MSYADNDAAGGWGGYDNPGYSSEQDNPGSSGNGGYSSSSDISGGQSVANTPEEAAIESQLDGFFGDIEYDEDLNKRGIFSPETTGFGTTFAAIQGTDKPSYTQYRARQNDLEKRAGDIWGDLSQNQKSALTYISAQTDNRIQTAIGRGLTGAMGAPMGAALGGFASIFDIISDADEISKQAQEAIGLSDEDMEAVNKTWTDVKVALAPENNIQSSSDFDPNTQTILNGQVVNQGEYQNALTDGIADPTSWEDKIKQYDTASIDAAMQAIRDVDTDITYQHTLADLSGIGMDANEKALLDSQKGIAIDRAITEIEDTFAPEGESIIAQQIHNLGTNALGGTIGQGFVKRWQEREAKAKTGALQDIESTYLAAERQGIDSAKQRQMDLWSKEYEGDVKSAELGLDKNKAGAMLQYDWDRSYLDRLATMRGQDISAEQANLDRLLKERMGNTEYDAWQDSNKWGAVGGVVGSVAGSDWFGDVVSGWF